MTHTIPVSKIMARFCHAFDANERCSKPNVRAAVQLNCVTTLSHLLWKMLFMPTWVLVILLYVCIPDPRTFGRSCTWRGKSFLPQSCAKENWGLWIRERIRILIQLVKTSPILSRIVFNVNERDRVSHLSLVFGIDVDTRNILVTTSSKGGPDGHGSGFWLVLAVANRKCNRWPLVAKGMAGSKPLTRGQNRSRAQATGSHVIWSGKPLTRGKKGSRAQATGSHVIWSGKPRTSLKNRSWAQGEVKPRRKVQSPSWAARGGIKG